MLCPACNRPVQANPLGRWFARFRCPHCGAALKFDDRTNTLGAIAALSFLAAGVYVSLRGQEAMREWPFIAAAVAWLAFMGASYALRAIARDPKGRAR